MVEKRKRRPRDPEATREAILEAARTLLAKNGPEALSLSEVAHLAGVNRGTAYQHFETRENLVQATIAWVSDRLFRECFGDPETIGERRVDEVDMVDMTSRLAEFAMANPELCRIWLQQVLATADPASDPFWREYVGSTQRFAETEMAEPDIDVEVMSVIMLAGTFLWPIWVHSHAEDAEGRARQVGRLTRECLRLSMYGTLRAPFFPAIAKRISASEE